MITKSDLPSSVQILGVTCEWVSFVEMDARWRSDFGGWYMTRVGHNMRLWAVPTTNGWVAGIDFYDGFNDVWFRKFYSPILELTLEAAVEQAFSWRPFTAPEQAVWKQVLLRLQGEKSPPLCADCDYPLACPKCW